MTPLLDRITFVVSVGADTSLAVVSFTAAFCILVLWMAYLVVLAVHRIFFSPNAHIPGPKLAALTS
ncbi:hypothetical protein BGW36DRAFT_390048 [Talaromyces proteolyticus]|uniref:Uncharacterized protein n=1 Tax=Talaromyces proteolyticus TaxID=1131652 RepID=A0AAD4PT06_9EURO|nr:uncharacterized protein BGW36DRAFT_390048 [Talaromyces proteolyticus]KAH8689994.1 hypothetical protein BGW36DRAFT_390048 [Talaromyces proteolyticus]